MSDTHQCPECDGSGRVSDDRMMERFADGLRRVELAGQIDEVLGRRPVLISKLYEITRKCRSYLAAELGEQR